MNKLLSTQKSPSTGYKTSFHQSHKKLDIFNLTYDTIRKMSYGICSVVFDVDTSELMYEVKSVERVVNMF